MSIKKKILAFILCGLTAASALTMTSCGNEDTGSGRKHTSSSDSDKDKEESGSDDTDEDEEEETAKETDASDEDEVQEEENPEEDESEEIEEIATPFDASANVEIMNFTAPKKGDDIIEMTIKDYGTVKIRLFPEYAGKGSENFRTLAEQGYYDGLTFHRVIQDFMIQGGDPNGNGTGGESCWGGKFDGGVNGHLIHVPGALCYANSGSTATNGSQFYIVTGSPVNDDYLNSLTQYYGMEFSENQRRLYNVSGGTPHLDGSYTVFGQVIDGLDIIFAIQRAATNETDVPLTPVIIDSVKVTKYNGEPIKWYISDYS